MIVILLILFLLFLLYPKEMFLYSDSILGRLVAISIIVFLTYKNVIHGLFACICLIWFYQSDILAKHKLETETEPFTELAPAPIVEKSLPKLDIYDQETIPLHSESETIFRNQHCSPNLELMYKESKIIHPEMVSQIFPEVSFLDNITCNPCDPKCNIRVTKIEKEAELMPKQTRGIEWIEGWLPLKSNPFQGIGYVASYFS
jgi:hypothetical protein